jgi:hypothetical protein
MQVYSLEYPPRTRLLIAGEQGQTVIFPGLRLARNLFSRLLPTQHRPFARPPRRISPPYSRPILDNGRRALAVSRPYWGSSFTAPLPEKRPIHLEAAPALCALSGLTIESEFVWRGQQ